MDIPILSKHHAICVIIAIAASAPVAATNPPPTPRPGTLAAYAGRVSLRRTESGGVTISNDNLAAMAAAGTVTLGVASTRGAAQPKQPDAAERTRWRKAYRAQRLVVAGIERRRALVEVEIDHIEDGGLTAKTMAHLEHVQAKARVLDEQIEQERGELGRIVREARRHGAEPGWFR